MSEHRAKVGSVTREQTISSERVYEGRVVNLRIDTVRMPDGSSRRREIVEHRGAVAIVAVTGADEILLVRQFRSAPGRELLEIPAGTREPDEPIEECVQRELQEETGHRAGHIEHLVGFYSSPGFCTEYLDVYLVRDLTPSVLPVDDDEHIDVVRVPVARLRDLISAGEINDAKSITGLLVYLTSRTD